MPDLKIINGTYDKIFGLIRNFATGQFSQYVPEFINSELLISKIKLISFFLTVGLSFIFMIILIKLRRLSFLANPPVASVTTQNSPKLSEGPYRARWDEITKHMESAKEAEWKFAVIEADKLADLVLKRAGFVGDSMGDRLVNIQDGQIISLQDLWDAHKVRNQLAHNVDYFLRYSEARQAIEKYNSFLQEMGVL